MSYSGEASLLAEDLMKYVFEKRGLCYVSRSRWLTEKYRGRNGMSPFRLVIGDSVCIGIDENLYELYMMFQQEFETKVDAVFFRRHAMMLVSDWFPDGYHPNRFIEFCIMIVSTAVFVHDAGYHEIPSFASEAIAEVLTQQMLKGEFKQQGGWEKLIKISTELVILHRQKSFGLRR